MKDSGKGPKRGSVLLPLCSAFEPLGSVLLPRDDLPRMPPLMAALFLLLFLAAAAAGALLWTPARPEAPLDPENLAGILASLPFFPLAVSLCSLVILLWRRALSLLSAPASFGVMLLFGVRIGDALALSLSLLVLSYVFAVSLISKEDRFRRITTLALFTAAAFAVSFAVRFLFDYPSPRALLADWTEVLPGMIAKLVLASVPGAGSVIPDLTFRMMAREFTVMLPALFGVFSVVFAWASDRIVRTLFVWLRCRGVFTDEDAEVTVPPSFAGIYAGVFAAYLLTVAGTLPNILLRTFVFIMGLPCAAVGVRRISERLGDRLFYMSREKIFIALLLVTGFFMLGAVPFLMVTSAVGAASVLLRARKKKNDKSE